jgi:ASCH domain
MFRALLIRHPWVDMILDGKKTWEIRGAKTSVREIIGLIPSGSGGSVAKNM